MANQDRGSFGSKLGIILATAGSAVGLGNIWRFPYMTGMNGGAAFILVYLVFVLMLGVPGMVAEFVVGRASGANAAKAYKQLAGRTPFRVIGYLGVLTSMIILGFYAVVAGWCLQYLFASVVGHVDGNPDYVLAYFQEFSSNPWKPTLWAVGFVVLTHLVVVRGVRNGIERASKLLMPTLLVLLVIIIVAVCMLPGAGMGISFLFYPDFSKIDRGVIFDALGQAFFSLSLGTACLCTYASYFSRQTNLLGSAIQIALLDTFVAVLAGLIIFPAAFSVGVDPDSGPSLIFITLPNVFHEAFGSAPSVGYTISILFYALLSLAALTSTISMHEIGTAFFYEEFHLSRGKGALVVTVACCVIFVWGAGRCEGDGPHDSWLLRFAHGEGAVAIGLAAHLPLRGVVCASPAGARRVHQLGYGFQVLFRSVPLLRPVHLPPVYRGHLPASVRCHLNKAAPCRSGSSSISRSPTARLS